MIDTQDFFKSSLTAVEAKNEAQKLAFAPIAFQAIMVLRKTGILLLISESKAEGLSIELLSSTTGISEYGIRVLVESAHASGVLELKDENYTLSKMGYFVLHDELTSANFDFVQDVCYQGMFHLDNAIKEGKPSGLKVFGEWDTVYEGLSALDENIRKSWFGFDHYYSDRSFPDALKIVFDKKVDTLLDIGGNTGRWATQCVNYDDHINITIFDLPGQISTAQNHLQHVSNNERIHFHPGNLLDPKTKIPSGFNIYWMSQFLDCFSEDEIVSILSRVNEAKGANGKVYIMETFWDNQCYKGAAYSLVQTSLYFTCMANGNSKMYGKNEFEKLIKKAGLSIDQVHENVGIGHTIHICS